MNTKDIPLYGLLALFAIAGVLVIRHDTRVQVEHFALGDSAQAAVASAPATRYRAVESSADSRTALRAWSLQNYGASYMERTVSGTISIVYQEAGQGQKPLAEPRAAYLVSDGSAYRITSIGAPVPERLDGATVTLTGLVSGERKSGDKEMLVNVSEAAWAREPLAARAPRRQGGSRSASCEGNYCALVIPIATPDTQLQLPAPADIESYIMDGDIAAVLADESGGTFEYDGMVTEWISVASSSVPIWEAMPEVDQYIYSNNIDIGQYDQIVFLVAGGPDGAGGLATLGESFFMSGGNAHAIAVARVGFASYQNNANELMANGNLSHFSYLYAHETGHNIGAGHDSLLNCHKGPLATPSSCLYEEYGNNYSLMGGGALGSHMSPLSKVRVGWKSMGDFIMTSSGTHTLTPTEMPGATYLGVDYGSNGVPEYLFERRASTGFDTVSLFPNTDLVGAFMYRMRSTVDWSMLPTDPFAWDMPLVDVTPGKYATDWPSALSVATLKLPNRITDVDRALAMWQYQGGNNEVVAVGPAIASNTACTARPIQVFDAPHANDAFVGQIAPQAWPGTPFKAAATLPELSGNVTDVNSNVLIAKTFVIFNDDGVRCPSTQYSFRLLFGGAPLTLMSDTSAAIPAWSGPHYQTIFAFMPVYGLSYGPQTVTLEVAKQNDGTVFSEDLNFELVP